MNKNFQTDRPRIAVTIPCFNEQASIGKVIRDFKKALPEAEIIVFDNDSTDETAKVAKESGALVIRERRRGKGNVVRAIFDKIEADYYLLVDGDDTYPAEEARKMIALIQDEQADMVVGTRLDHYSRESSEFLHSFGNRLLLKILNFCFHTNLSDILSGYRVFTREFVKSVPLFSTGFEIETELTIQALMRGFRILEVPITYRARPEGGKSKIRPFKDGYRILMTILIFTRDLRPMLFFPILSAMLIIGALIPGFRVIREYLQTGLIRYLPSAILATGMVILGILFFIAGFIIDTLNRRFNEINFVLKRMQK
ncbi:MAG: glycosyltransferase family 2 protein [bacterium]|nr:glycosyltransferase family 2 protein [bacterium]